MRYRGCTGFSAQSSSMSTLATSTGRVTSRLGNSPVIQLARPDGKEPILAVRAIDLPALAEARLAQRPAGAVQVVVELVNG
jgi:hypothetical protein